MRTGHVAIGLAAVVGVVPAAFAQDLRVLDQGKQAGTAERQTQQRFGRNTGLSVAVPIGRVSVSPEFADGEPVYVRRTTVSKGMTIVEVSTTPFMPVLPSGEAPAGGGQSVARPEEQPAPW